MSKPKLRHCSVYLPAHPRSKKTPRLHSDKTNISNTVQGNTVKRHTEVGTKDKETSNVSAKFFALAFKPGKTRKNGR